MAYPPANAPDRATGDVIAAAHINALDAAIQDVVAELGSSPKGGSADLTARLAALDSVVALKALADASNITASTWRTALGLVLGTDIYSKAATDALIAALSGTYAAVGALRPRMRLDKSARRPVVVADLGHSGHGWTRPASSNGSDNANDTGDFVIGTQSYKFVTGGTGSANDYIESANSIGPFDLTSKYVRLWVKAVNQGHMTTGTLRLSNDNSYTNYWQFTWFTLGQPTTEGDWVPIVLDFSAATAVGSPTKTGIIKARLRALDDNTGQAVTLRIGGIELLDDVSTLYPNGVVSVCFDDCFSSQYTFARPYMDKYGFGATNHVIVDQVGTAGHVTLDQLKALERENGWEIAGHAFTLADHAAGFTTLSAGDLETELRSLKQWLVDNNFSGQDLLAYPLGDFNSTVEAAVLHYFAAARTTLGQFYETVPPSVNTRMRAQSFNSTSVTVAAIQAKIDAAYANGSWLILTFHDFIASGATGTTTNHADFQSIIDYLATKGIPVRTIGDVLAGRIEKKPTPEPKQNYLKATATKFETLRGGRSESSSSNLAITSQQLYLFGIELPKDVSISTIAFFSGTTVGSGFSHQWFGLFDQNRVALGFTSDDTSTAWSGSSKKALNLAAPVVTTYEGLHYVGIMIHASTMPTIVGAPVLSAIVGEAPIVVGGADTGLTTPPTLPFTATTLTANKGVYPYAYVA